MLSDIAHTPRSVTTLLWRFNSVSRAKGLTNYIYKDEKVCKKINTLFYNKNLKHYN